MKKLFSFGYSERTLRFYVAIYGGTLLPLRDKTLLIVPNPGRHRTGTCPLFPMPRGSGRSAFRERKSAPRELRPQTAGVDSPWARRAGSLLFRFLTIPLLCLTLILFPSCAAAGELLPGRDPVPPEASVAAMCSTQKELPKGQLYASSAPEGDSGYVSDALLAAFLGDGKNVPWQLDGVRDFAFYLSYTAPVTFAVFRCGTRDRAGDLADLCLSHVRTLQNYWSGTEWEAATSGAVVTVKNNDVILAIAPNGKSAVKTV